MMAGSVSCTALSGVRNVRRWVGMAETQKVRSLSDNLNVPLQIKIEISCLKAEGRRIKKHNSDIVKLTRPRRANHVLHLLLRY